MRICKHGETQGRKRLRSITWDSLQDLNKRRPEIRIAGSLAKIQIEYRANPSEAT
jgi:hypothetical protein